MYYYLCSFQQTKVSNGSRSQQTQCGLTLSFQKGSDQCMACPRMLPLLLFLKLQGASSASQTKFHPTSHKKWCAWLKTSMHWPFTCKPRQPALWIPCLETRHLNGVPAFEACAYIPVELAGSPTWTTIQIQQLLDPRQTQTQHLFGAAQIRSHTATPPGLKKKVWGCLC